jgi:MFS family permease
MPAMPHAALFGALLLPYVLSNFYRAFLAVVSAPLARDLGLDAAALASFQAVFLFAFAAVQLPIGVALDRVGPRAPMVAGLVSATVGSLLFSASTGFGSAAVAMALLGAGFGPVLMTGFYVIARTFPAGRYAAMTSLLYGLGSLGDPLSGVPLAAATAAFGWRATLFGMTALVAASAVVALVLLRRAPGGGASGPATPPWRALRQVLAIRALWWLVPVSLASYSVVAATRGLWIAPYLATVHGAGLATVAGCATAMGLAIAGGGLLYAPISRLVGDAKRTVAWGLGTTAVAWLALAFLGAGSLAASIGLLLFAACFGTHFAIVIAHARALLPAHLLGLGVTWVNLLFFAGAALAQWLSGLHVRTAQAAGLPPAEVFARLFGGFGLALAVVLLVYLGAPRARADAG